MATSAGARNGTPSTRGSTLTRLVAAAIQHHVNRMQARGLVGREACPDDGRGAVIFLTASGWATLRAAAPWHVRSVREHFIDLLTEDQIDALAEIAATVIAHLAEVGHPATWDS